ncbi:hypothetical protein 1 [Beihai picorna-like virus 84]|uniref:hypothetical protein 1 n=1 Tax=Beihai picorna-like virus 84 TaxID=1922632 RepID=UPI00090B3069|nr:hypothetical protein 1 [Beihai picorna-like virus 84]APG76879.1 hypothetical protein 1 [Beihai picorna-like virus 84]
MDRRWPGAYLDPERLFVSVGCDDGHWYSLGECIDAEWHAASEAVCEDLTEEAPMMGESDECDEATARRKCTSASGEEQENLMKLVEDLKLANSILTRQFNKAQMEKRKLEASASCYARDARRAEKKKTLMKKARREGKEMRGQGFGDLFNGTTATKAHVMMEEVSAAALVTQEKVAALDVESINAVTAKFNGIMDSISKMAASVCEVSVIDVCLGLMNLYSAVTTMSATSALTAVTLLTRCLGVSRDHLSTVVEYVCEYVKGTYETVTNIGERMCGESLTLNPFRILSAITGVIATAMEMTIGNVTDPLRVITRHLTELSKLQKGIEGTQKLMANCFDQLKATYYRLRYGLSVEEYESKTKYPRYAQAAALAKVISGIPLGPINRYKDLAVQINLVDNELKTLQAEATRTSNAVMRSLMTEAIRMCMTQTAAARESPAISCKSRTAPHCTLVYGRSGVGKSMFVQMLKYKLYGDVFCKTVPGIDGCSFDRKVETEFWDGYRKQPIVTYDDFGQKVDSASNPNPEGLEIIYAVNTNPYQLHMSDIKDKSATFFESSVIICTTNTKLPHFKSLTDKTAVLRRFDRFLEVTIKPEYGILTDSNNPYYRFDEKKATEHLEQTGTRYSTDHYVIIEYDMDGQFVKEYTFDEFYAVYLNDVKRNLSKGSTMHEEMCKATGVTCEATSLEDAEFYEDYMKQLDAVRVEKVLQECEDRTLDLPEKVRDGCERLKANAFGGAATFLETVTERKTDVKALVTKYTIEALDYMEYAFERVKACAGRVLSAAAEKACKLWDFLMECFGAMCGRVQKKAEENPQMTAVLAACSAMGALVAYGLHRYLSQEKDAVDMLAEFASGDKKTARRRKEARGEFASGDARSLRRRKAVKAEAFTSGDAKTRRRARAARGEDEQMIGQQETVKIERRCGLVTIDEDDKVESQVFGEGCEVRAQQATAAMMRNSVYLQVHREGGPGVCSTGLFLTGRTMLAVAHCFPVDAESVTLYNPAQRVANVTIPMKQLKITKLNKQSERPVDLALVTFPNVVTARPQIVKNFAEASRYGDLCEGTLVLSTIRRFPVTGPVAQANLIFGEEFTKEYGRVTTESYVTAERTDLDGNVLEAEKVVTTNDMMEYFLDTRPGMCGALVSVDNACFVSKFVGIHVAGNGSRGFAVCTSREFLERSLREHAEKHGLKDDALVNARVPYGEASVEIRDDVVDLLLEGDCIGMGKAPCSSRPTKTKLSPSLIQNEVYTTTTKPARLGPFRGADGVMIDPMKKGLKKVLNKQTPMNDLITRVAVDDYFQVLQKNKGSPRVLTYEEAITGDGFEMLGPVNRQTSAGYPWSMTTSMPGKTKWLGSGDEWVLDNAELREECDKLEDHARRNERGDVVFTAQLKDERRECAKVDIGKTRVFESAPIHYVIVFRKYFGSFVDHCMRSENRIDNEMSVGINPYSIEWDKLARRLQSKGTKVFAGDFSNFDGSVPSDGQAMFVEKINEWYNDGPENARIRRILAMHVYNADVIVDGEIIRQTHSHPSGHPGTVIWNCLTNGTAIRQAYYTCALQAGLKWGEIPAFRKHVAFISYGDDNAANVSDEVAPWFNQETVTEAMAKYGYTYTDEAKSGITVKTRRLADISFLKRKFVYDDEWRCHVAPMDLNTILDIPNWVRGAERRQATVLNVETIQRELALHGRDVFDEYMPQFREALARAGLSADLSGFDYWEQVLASDRGQI